MLLDLDCQCIALHFGQFLGVAQPVYRTLRIEDDRGREDRTSQRPAPGFIHTANDVLVQKAEQ
ncbi:hypothetical protein D3C71_2188520 [compost metagenome]